MKIALIDVDGHNFPNLPLMKISEYHKRHGDCVEWIDPFDKYDIAYKSKVFSFTPDYPHPINANIIESGGSGYAIQTINGVEFYNKNLDINLPPEVENIMPDYSLYKLQNTAIGFLTRGCPRACSFCHVKDKEGLKSIKVADLNQFWNGQKNLILCDPNFFACIEWENLLIDIIKSNAIVDFNQGIDIRLLNKEKIKLLNMTKMNDIHFAFDTMNNCDIVLEKLELYKKYGKIKKVTVFVLVNYNTTFEQDLWRIDQLKKLKFNPFVMIYNKANAAVKYKQLAGWVNNKIIFKSCENFADYNRYTKKTLHQNQLVFSF